MSGAWVFPAGSRYFENVVPATNTEKFWCYALRPRDGGGIVVEVFWGRIGFEGQRKPFPFANQLDARDFVNDKLVEKLRKGYTERDPGWVRRFWGNWRPPIAVDTPPPGVVIPTDKAKRPPLIVPPEPAGLGNLAAPKPKPMPRPIAKAKSVVVPVRGGRRVLDFSEDD